MATQPDLIVFVTDQQRYDQVGYASGGQFETPQLDALAAAGVIFENAYSASTFCVPARTALLTGLHPHRLPTQVNRFALREGFWTVAHTLRDAGYETALIGKMHFAPVHAEHGFETMRLCEHLNAQGLGPDDGDEERDGVDDYHSWLEENDLDDWRFRDGELLSYVPEGTFPGAADIHPTAWIERETLTFLEARTGDRPLFLIVSFPAPHAPYNPPEPYASMYDPADSPRPRTGFDANKGLPQVFRDAASGLGSRAAPRVDPDDPSLLTTLALVRGLIKQVDDSLGRIVDRLDLADTVVFFTSDHGDYAGNRGLLRKFPWIPYDDLARVALMVVGGDVVGGRRLSELVQSCDIALTCLDLAGIAPPPGVDFGTRSLVPLLREAPNGDAADRPVFSQLNLGWPMVRRGPFKLLWQTGWEIPVLFDLERDPTEQVNLANDPAYQEIVADLRGLLDAQLQLGIPTLPSYPDRGPAGQQSPGQDPDTRQTPTGGGMAKANYEWIDGDLVVDRVRFVPGNAGRFDSTVERFCLVKRPELVQNYLSLLEQRRPTTIMELGIFQGGSTALLALLANPELLIAIDHSPARVPALDELIERRGLQDRVHPVYGVDQSDVEALGSILDEHAAGTEFDLIIDDASHLVTETRASFNFLFPRLRPGGLYVIEDWSWAHIGYGLHRPDEVPLTQFVFELTMALPSRPGLISDIHIDRDWATIVRGIAPIDTPDFDLSNCYSDRARALLAEPDR